MDYTASDRTIVLSRNGQPPATDSLLSDTVATPRYEELEARMVFAARVRPAETFSISLNPLVAAATPLLSEAVRIRNTPDGEDLPTLQASLSTALREFEHRALQEGVESAQVMAARYVLCSLLDEAVVTTPWGVAGEWSQMSLLSSFHNETFGGEKVFQLLERLSRNPVKHLPMLELLYLCLALGFEGRYRVLPRGMVELEAVRDGLYRQIRQLHGDVPRELSPHWEGLGGGPRRLLPSLPAWKLALASAALLGVLYASLAWLLGTQRDALLQPYLQAGSPVITTQSGTK